MPGNCTEKWIPTVLPRPLRKTRTRKIRHGLKLFMRRLVRSILHSRGTPRAVALGAAIGIFVACTPTIGFQMIIAAALATLCGANRLPAIVMVYISNPLTAVPLYGFCYKVGSVLLAWFGFNPLSWARLSALFKFGGGEPLLTSVWQKFISLLSLGWDITLPLWVGCFLVGAVSAAISYPLLVRLVEGHRLIRAEKRARRLAKRQQ